jgi:hypothetical protein
VGKPDKNIPLGRPRSRWENNIKMNLKKGGIENGRDCCGLGLGTGDGHF